MDEIMETIKSKRNISESTLKTYRRHLTKVLKLLDTNNITALDEAEKVIEAIESSDGSLSSKRGYVASLVVYMDAYEKMEIAKVYRECMLKQIKDEKDNLSKNEKTEKQKANWTTSSELENVIKGYDKQIKFNGIMKKDTITKQEKLLLQKYVLAMLYCGDTDNHPPVRLDYSPMLVINENEYNEKNEKNELPTGMNFLVVKSRNKKKFAFHNYKTFKTHGIKIVPLSSKINTAVNKLLKYNKTDYLFENNLLRPLTSNSLGKLLTATFKDTGKDITVNMLRHIYISERYPVEKTKEQEEYADKMLHTTTAQKIYAKQ